MMLRVMKKLNFEQKEDEFPKVSGHNFLKAGSIKNIKKMLENRRKINQKFYPEENLNEKSEEFVTIPELQNTKDQFKVKVFLNIGKINFLRLRKGFRDIQVRKRKYHL